MVGEMTRPAAIRVFFLGFDCGRCETISCLLSA